MPTIGKFIETESRGWEEDGEEFLFNWYRILVWEVKIDLEMNGGDHSTTMWM